MPELQPALAVKHKVHGVGVGVVAQGATSKVLDFRNLPIVMYDKTIR